MKIYVYLCQCFFDVLWYVFCTYLLSMLVNVSGSLSDFGVLSEAVLDHLGSVFASKKKVEFP